MSATGLSPRTSRGRYFMFNPSAKSLNGNALPDVPFAERSAAYGLYHPDSGTLFAEDDLPLVRALRGEATNNIEMCVRNERNPDGTFIVASGRPLYDKNDNLKGGRCRNAGYNGTQESRRRVEGNDQRTSKPDQNHGKPSSAL